MFKTIVGIDGMSCGMCEAHVNDTIRKGFPGVKVKSSAGKKRSEIIYERALSEDELRKVLDPTGYKVTSVESVPYEKKKLFGKKA